MTIVATHTHACMHVHRPVSCALPPRMQKLAHPGLGRGKLVIQHCRFTAHRHGPFQDGTGERSTRQAQSRLRSLAPARVVKSEVPNPSLALALNRSEPRSHHQTNGTW